MLKTAHVELYAVRLTYQYVIMYKKCAIHCVWRISLLISKTGWLDDVVLLAEMSVRISALEVMDREASPLGMTINWAKTKLQDLGDMDGANHDTARHSSRQPSWSRLSPMLRYAPALGSHFCQTMSAAVVCPSLDISTELTPDRIITELSRPALQAHLTTGDGGLALTWQRITAGSRTGDLSIVSPAT